MTALTTYNQICDDIRDERAYFDSDDDRAIHEMAEALTPVYYSGTMAQWAELPLDACDTWQEFGIDENATILDRMNVDLFWHYHNAVSRAWDEIRDEHQCDTATPAGIAISPSGTLATCDFCEFKSGLWECACELVHDCATDSTDN